MLNKKFRYHFENFIAKKSNFVYVIIISAAALAVLMILIEYGLGLLEQDSFISVWWYRFKRLLKIDANGSNFQENFIDASYWFFSVAFSGTIIAFLAAKISSFLQAFKNGRSMVIDTNHYVIVGWNSTIFKIFEEIKIANENQEKPTILCFNGMDNVEMNAKIDLEHPNKKGLRIITRSGDVYSAQDLERTNMAQAKCVIILDDTITPNFNIETSILATKINLNKRNTPIIPQMFKEGNIELLSKNIGKDIYPIYKNKTIANVTAQTIRGKHISSIVLDFLDYDGDEIYFFPSNDLCGKTFKQAMVMLSEVTLIGLMSSNETVTLNPEKERIILKDDFLIVIAHDDDIDIKHTNCSSINDALNQVGLTPDNSCQKEELSILVLGWSKMGSEIINKTLPFLGDNAYMHIAYRKELVLNSPENTINSQIRPNFTELQSNQNTAIRNILDNNEFDIVLIVGYDDILPKIVADTNVLMLNSYVQSVLDEKNLSKSPRIILHLNDGSKKELIPDNPFNELIVSDNLSALVITQLADNPKLWYVFEELFNGGGLKIHETPVTKYCLPNQSQILTVTDLILMALEKDQTFIGYISDDKLYLNPPKNHSIRQTNNLSLVYIK